MIFLIILVVISLLINIFFIFFDKVFSGFEKKYLRRYFAADTNDEIYRAKVITASLKMIKKRKTYMEMPEQTDFFKRLISLVIKNPYSRLARYFYPKSYLLAGVVRYGIKTQDKNIVDTVEKVFSFYLNVDGTPNFKVDKIDQAPFGLVAIDLYRWTKNNKYKIFSDSIFHFIEKTTNDSGLVLYNPNYARYYVDTLGMLCPFLMEYNQEFPNKRVLELALHNMNFYMENGLDTKSHLPFHAINLDTGLRLGPTNWGRGITWYLLGLYSIIKNTTEQNNPYYANYLFELEAVHATLEKERKENLWTQFPGCERDFDASASVAYAYVFNEKNNEEIDAQIMRVIKSKTSITGLIDFTSGDSNGINRYSSSKSYSEFSQGMLLFYLSTKV